MKASLKYMTVDASTYCQHVFSIFGPNYRHRKRAAVKYLSPALTAKLEDNSILSINHINTDGLHKVLYKG